MSSESQSQLIFIVLAENLANLNFPILFQDKSFAIPNVTVGTDLYTWLPPLLNLPWQYYTLARKIITNSIMRTSTTLQKQI